VFHSAPLRSELFVEGNEFAGLASFARKVCGVLGVEPVQGVGAVDGYIVCQTMDVRLVLTMVDHRVFPYCNYRISVENELSQEVPIEFVFAVADTIARKLTTAGLNVVRGRHFDP
jgi:hypothetical protein